MERVSMAFLKKNCMGCHACEVACKQEYGLDVGPRLVQDLERVPITSPYAATTVPKPLAKRLVR